MTWSDFDLDRGAMALDENKTDDPRAWALSPGVTEAMCAWRDMRARQGADVGDDALVFVDENGQPIGKWHAAAKYREHLIAGQPLVEIDGNDAKTSDVPIACHDMRCEIGKATDQFGNVFDWLIGFVTPSAWWTRGAQDEDTVLRIIRFHVFVDQLKLERICHLRIRPPFCNFHLNRHGATTLGMQ